VVKIRLMRLGRKKMPVYRLVVTESASARNGRFIETIGTYNPIGATETVQLNAERAKYWISVGAQPTAAAAGILRRNGVEFKGHPKGEYVAADSK